MREKSQPKGANADNSIQESGGTWSETPHALVSSVRYRDLHDPERAGGFSQAEVESSSVEAYSKRKASIGSRAAALRAG